MRERKLSVLLFVGVILISTGVHASCPIELSPPRVVVKHGDPVLVNCTSLGYEGLGWEVSQGGTGRVAGASILLWNVTSVTHWSMKPMCYLDANASSCHKTLQLVIYTFPENIHISSSGSNGVMKEGLNYTFTCQIYEIAPVTNLTITWYKGHVINHAETLNSDEKEPTNQTAVFSFTPTRNDNNATFRCEAFMDLGPEGPQFNVSSQEYQIQVLYGPEQICPSSYTVPEHSPHNLKCTQGFPEPDEIWYKDGEEVKLPEILTRTDSGQYWVTARNSNGGINFTVDISVHYPPSDINELEDAVVDVGDNLTLKCSSVSSPKPKYSWNYYQVSHVRESADDGVSFLHIHNATGYNTGFYTCNAWNERGSFAKTVKVTVKGARQECPITIKPEMMVVQYQSMMESATCETNDPTQLKKLYWQDAKGTKKLGESWLADPHNDWDPNPTCHADFQGIGPCQKTLLYTLYKTPDMVSIHAVNNTSKMLKDGELQLQCDIINVAPAQNLTVRWIWIKGTDNGTLEGNNMNCNTNTIRSPVNVSCTIDIPLNSIYNRTEIRCEANLDLGPGGPLAKDQSNSIVFYEPRIKTKQLPEKVPVIRGYSETLLCEADGNPPPKIHWSFTSKSAHLNSDANLTVLEPGLYNCTATNVLNSHTHMVQVILKEDYLPLIAGFVAVTVVAISIVFLFIYSIYYKNTKMRRYSLKNPKLSTHTGNVAHNGWDTQFPMTKLS